VKRALSFAAIAVAAVALAACAATQPATAVAPAAPGFWLGVWHGFIFPVAFLVSLFKSAGGWYDFGYFVGIVFIGVGARKARR